MNSFEYHVSPAGNNINPGTLDQPLKSIQAAADRAQAGDTVIVHEGVYREYVNPPRGGSSDSNRIVYRAAKGEQVQIKGSEPIKGWKRIEANIWNVKISNSFFGDFNPYKEKIRGHWFIDNGRDHHPGAVYLNNHWLIEAETFEELRKGGKEHKQWFASVDGEFTTIWAEFKEIDPNLSNVEIAVRQSVFYPSKSGISYLTVSGFELYHAATPWAPPTTEQIGLIGTNWGKGWIIENNRIAYSACSGITLGKYDDPEDFGDRDLVEFTTSEDTYHRTIRLATEHGWSLESTGNHIVRGNHVSHCEMAGICGSLGAVKSIVENNVVHDIFVHRQFNGHEQAGIKFHAPIDSLIRKNIIYNCPKGLWMDWMTQGNRITQNLCFQNGPDQDLYTEVNHGPAIVDHNLFLSDWSVRSCSEGTLFAHNLFAGKFSSDPILNRTTPYHKEHSTEIVAFKEIPGGDDHIIRNVFRNAQHLDEYGDEVSAPSVLKDNQILHADQPFEFRIEDNKIIIRYVKAQIESGTGIIETAALKPTKVSKLPFLNFDGSELRLDEDFFGNKRNNTQPTIGPFETNETSVTIDLPQ